jgi:type II restriction/modification system DNA methylase subunit YeeA
MSTSASVFTPLSPVAFIKKWKRVSLSERQAAQEHFVDLCALFDHPTPSEDDPTGQFFAFEKGATKLGGGRGFADVWKKGYFAWEYKRKNGNLDDALLQLMRYAPALASPPLHVVCDIERFRIHTAWTNTVPHTYEIGLDELTEPATREILRNVFHDPEKLKPTRTRAGVTAEAADKFSTIAFRLQGRGTPDEIAHFVNQLVFCFFAQSVKLLPEGLFTKLLRRSALNPDRAIGYLNKLFEAMERGGEFDLSDIAWFNGGLFDGRRALRLDEGDVGLLIAADSLDWSLIDPTIFGTLFERFLDPEKRAQIGAHYTDPDKIMRLVDPVILRPLRSEWECAKHEIITLLNGKRTPPMRKKPHRRMSREEAAEEVRSRFMERLRNLRILDPACGSGNFLYLALQGVKDIEHQANLDCEMLGLKPQLPLVGPEILRGIEVNGMAAELARTTIWIGDIQWQLRNGIRSKSIPILRKLEAIETRDALLTSGDKEPLHGQIEAPWPEAEFIVGNPPFLGGKLLRGGLGDDYVETLFEVYDGRVPREADLVTYWFEKARAEIAGRRTKATGLVSTNSIRGGANRKVLERLTADAEIFEAWSDEPWVVEGAAVRVSLVCFGETQAATSSSEGKIGQALPARLNGVPVLSIFSDLTAGGRDLTRARRLRENEGIAFQGVITRGPFDIESRLAQEWLSAPLNPNGRPNSDVIIPIANGADLTRRSRGAWVIDLSRHDLTEAQLYEAVFEHIGESAKAARSKVRDRDAAMQRWWGLWRAREEMRSLFAERYIFTPRVSKHRFFVFAHRPTLPDDALIAVARDDDTSFGILNSRFHEQWALRLGTSLEDRPRYTPTTTFETFPFPEGLTPNVAAPAYADDQRAQRIAVAARELDQKRRAWLNPPDLADIVPEIVPTAAPGEVPVKYPDRIVPKGADAAVKLAERTLTNLYNQRPQWLVALHDKLDHAVAAAYGWPLDISDEDALANLLDLNLARPAVGESSKSATPTKPSRRKPQKNRQQTELLLPIKGGKPAEGQQSLPLNNEEKETTAPSRSHRRQASR